MARLVAPVLYEVRASVLVDTVAAASLAASGGERAAATLADVPAAYWLDLRRTGFDIVYLLGVWTTGAAGLQHSIDKLGDATAVSSPFAVTDYHVDPALGGDAALRALRTRAHAAGLRVLLDFVPNHVARDHRWTWEKPWLFVQGSEADAARHRGRFFEVALPPPLAPVWLAHGRDPHSGGWADTAQLNYRHPQLRGLMKAILVWCVRACGWVCARAPCSAGTRPPAAQGLAAVATHEPCARHVSPTLLSHRAITHASPARPTAPARPPAYPLLPPPRPPARPQDRHQRPRRRRALRHGDAGAQQCGPKDVGRPARGAAGALPGAAAAARPA